MFFGLVKRSSTLAESFKPERFRVEPPSGSSSTPRRARIAPGLNKVPTAHAHSHLVQNVSVLIIVILSIATGMILVSASHFYAYFSNGQFLAASIATLFPETTSDWSSPIATPGAGPTLNLASVSNGATPIHDMTHSPQPGWLSRVTGRPRTSSSFSCTFCATPECAISGNATVDRCWTFTGFPGELAIALASPAYLTHVAIEHVQAESRLSSAPRDVVIWGLIEGEENRRKVLQSNDLIPKLLSHFSHRLANLVPTLAASSDVHHFLPIATFQYSIRPSDLYEGFDIFREIQDLEIDFGIIVIQINNNWGYFETHLHHVGIFGHTLISI